jgi:hypothetical protein
VAICLLKQSSNSASSSSSAFAATSTTNPKALPKKVLNSFISCINIANKSQGLSHKLATNRLDTAKGTSPTTSIDGRATIHSKLLIHTLPNQWEIDPACGSSNFAIVIT